MDLINHVKAITITAVFLLWGAVIFQPAAHAAPFSTDIVTTGSVIELYTDNDAVGIVGAFGAKQGGADTTSTYTGNTLDTGSNPIDGAFTDTGDGFSLSGAATGTEFFGGIDFELVLSNTSLTDTFDIVVRVDYSNSVTGDEFAESQFTIDDDTNGEDAFFTHVFSDADQANGGDFWANSNGAESYPGTYGGTITDAGYALLYYSLAAGGSDTLFGSWTGEGFDSSSLGFSATVSIDSVVNTSQAPSPVPEPGTFILLGCGLLCIARVSRRKSA